MGEMLFGPGPQLWSPLSAPTFSQITAFPGNRTTTPLANPSMVSAPMLLSPPSPDLAQIGAGHVAVAPLPIPVTGVPTIVPDFAMGIPPQALLSTVAIRRGQPMGPTTDQETEDFISDVLDLLPGAVDVEVRCEAGRILFTGPVPNKRMKRDVGEVAWAIPSVNDVQNNITIVARRRSRASGREMEAAAPGAGQNRKQA